MVSIYRTGYCSFACNYPKAGIFLGIWNKKYFELFVSNIFRLYNVFKTDCTRQFAGSGKFS